MPLGEKAHSLLTRLAAFLPARDPPLGVLQRLLRVPVVSRILDELTVRRDEEDLQSQIDACLRAGGREWLAGYVHTGKASVPAIGFLRESHCLDGTFEWATPADWEPSDLHQDEIAIFQRRPIAKLLVGKGMVPVAALKPGIAWLLSCLDPAEEGGKGTVESGEDILQHLGMDVMVLWAYRFDGGQLGTLVGSGDTLMAQAPGIPALLEGSVVEFLGSGAGRMPLSAPAVG